MSWTDPNSVIDSWVGPNPPTDASLVQTWIYRAEREVRRRVPDIQARIDGGLEPDLLDTVRDVVSAQVSRVFRNPEGIRQWQQTDGPFSEGRTYSTAAQGLALTAAELASLGGADRRPRAFEIDLAPDAGTVYANPEVWG